MKSEQAKAILDVFDEHLQSGLPVCFGRMNARWFARVGDTTCQGVTLQDALAQVAQVLTCEHHQTTPAPPPDHRGAVLPRDWTITLRRVREARSGNADL